MSKPHLSKLKTFVNTNNQWEAFVEMLDHEIDSCHKKLEQSKDIQDIYQAQGAIAALRRFKYLKDEVNVQ
jgi:predicted Rossmann-fold nucleotide-binding protein